MTQTLALVANTLDMNPSGETVINVGESRAMLGQCSLGWLWYEGDDTCMLETYIQDPSSKDNISDVVVQIGNK